MIFSQRAGAAALVGLLVQTGCPAQRDARPADITLSSVPASGSAPEPAVSSSAAPRVIAGDAPVEPGLVELDGMVRGAKDGLEIRGVIVDESRLLEALAARPRRGLDSILGAKVRIVAVVVRRGTDPEPPRDPSLAEQRRSGSWLAVDRLVRAALMAEPIQIEGEVTRSKGLYAVAGHLVTADDLRWSLVQLNGRFESARVRLWGQPRTVVCEPNAQCLIGGSLPMFDVARAELLP